MAARTVEIPESLDERLRERAEQTGQSVDTLILEAVSQTYGAPEKPKKGFRLTGPIITDMGERGPLYPTDETPYELIFP